MLSANTSPGVNPPKTASHGLGCERTQASAARPRRTFFAEGLPA
jgi:hypothetical protein